jgi:hypothetical protein
LEVCKEHGISEERFAELEQIVEGEKREGVGKYCK